MILLKDKQFILNCVKQLKRGVKKKAMNRIESNLSAMMYSRRVTNKELAIMTGKSAGNISVSKAKGVYNVKNAAIYAKALQCNLYEVMGMKEYESFPIAPHMPKKQKAVFSRGDLVDEEGNKYFMMGEKKVMVVK